MGEFEKMTVELDATKKRFTKTFLNNIGLFMGAFLIFAVIVIMTTDIHIVSLEEITSLGLDFFLLLFCSYSMYVCCADTGTKAGLSTHTYNEVVEKFVAMKKRIVDSKKQTRLNEFCNRFIEDELKDTRMAILAVVGFSYEQYKEKYMHLDGAGIDAIKELTKAQKKAIKKANKVKPIKLTPELVMRQGRNSHRRSPLEVNPADKKNILFGVKFLEISVLSIGVSMIALDVILEPSWIIFASVCLKLISVIMNGFGGYKTGYENIVLDTVNYMNGQIDLMEQAIQYIETNPIAEATTTND